jgi:hypothetical protein
VVSQFRREYLQNLPRDLNQNGFGLVHYLTLLSQNEAPTDSEVKLKYTPGGFGTFGNPGPRVSTYTPSNSPTSSEATLLKQMIADLSLDVNLKTSSGETPLALICQDEKHTDTGLVQILIEAGANVNEPVCS